MKRVTVHLQNSMGTRCGLWENSRTNKNPPTLAADIAQVTCGRCINIHWHDQQRRNADRASQ